MTVETIPAFSKRSYTKLTARYSGELFFYPEKQMPFPDSRIKEIEFLTQRRQAQPLDKDEKTAIIKLTNIS